MKIMSIKSIDTSLVTPAESIQYLQNAVAPRPIALVSTVDKEGNVNLSPFSFYNVFSSNPPILVFSPSRRVRDTTVKHTLENVQQVRECVINTVSYDIVHQSSLSSTEYGKGINEFHKAGLSEIPSLKVQPPRVKESKVSFECKVSDLIHLGDGGGAGTLVVCEVLMIHVDESVLNERGLIDTRKIDLVGRMGESWYTHSNGESLFEIPKPLATKGIGVDALPAEIRLSEIFTGNDLAMLANVETLPEGIYQSEAHAHLHAKDFLKESDVEGAWGVLAK
jgi:flavin reductase (DIM6/NTAB) family NADH-FMN oxidoreductase RutF